MLELEIQGFFVMTTYHVSEHSNSVLSWFFEPKSETENLETEKIQYQKLESKKLESKKLETEKIEIAMFETELELKRI